MPSAESVGLSKSPGRSRRLGTTCLIGRGRIRDRQAHHEAPTPTELDSDSFVAEVKKIRGKKKPLSAPALKSLREEYTRSIEPARALAVEALRLENEISCLVNEAYGLTPEEIALMWETAPPRMPIPRPG